MQSSWCTLTRMCASNGQPEDLDLTSVFEERAENLSKEELLRWTTYTSHDEENVTKLMGPGTKLLTGPRGSGKSTLLKTAYFRLLENRAALPVYVNYSKSLALEPMFHRSANALQLFRQWVLFKIIVATSESHDLLGVQVPKKLARRSRGRRPLRQLWSTQSPCVPSSVH